MKFSRKKRKIKEIPVGDSRLYILKNDLHKRPFGLLLRPEHSDVWQGIRAAEKNGCYKCVSFEDKNPFLVPWGKGFVHELTGGSTTVQGWTYYSRGARASLYLLDEFAFLEDVYVNPSKRGRGLGTSIVRHVIDEADRLGAYSLFCGVRLTNSPLHKWYTEMDFEDCGLEYRITFS